MKEKFTTLVILLIAALFYFGWVSTHSTPQVQVQDFQTAAPSAQVTASEFPKESIVDEVPSPAPVATPSPSPSVKPTPTPKPSSSPKPSPSPAVKKSPTPKPSPTPASPTPEAKTTIPTSGSYACNCAKTCEQISSCAEAQYQLNSCGCSVRDGDKDGIACDKAPLNCQP